MHSPFSSNRSALALAGLLALTAAAASPVAAAVLEVNSLGDDAIAGDGMVTLREAIAAANADTATDLGVSGSGSDILLLSALNGTIHLQSTLPAIATDMAWIGPGVSDLTLSGDDGDGARSRILVVDGGALSVTGMRFADGLAQGGKGGDKGQRCGSGGGGAGLGGAVFLVAGAFTARDVHFSGNVAFGGSSGAYTSFSDNCGGGGGGGIGGDGSGTDPFGPVGQPGGTGGSGAPLTLAGGASNSDGGPGAGGGGGTYFGIDIASRSGGDGGFGGGGGGGGQGPIDSNTALGGDGGFGGGGGGAGASGSLPDIAGGSGGMFGGNGGITAGNRNVASLGGGGAGLGGAVFALAGTLLLEEVRITGGIAAGGSSGSFPGEDSAGTPGQGKAAALFIGEDATARIYRLTFDGNEASDASGGGFIPGSPSDTDDVFGVLVDQVLLVDDFEAQ